MTIFYSGEKGETQKRFQRFCQSYLQDNPQVQYLFDQSQLSDQPCQAIVLDSGHFNAQSINDIARLRNNSPGCPILILSDQQPYLHHLLVPPFYVISKSHLETDLAYLLKTRAQLHPPIVHGQQSRKETELKKHPRDIIYISVSGHDLTVQTRQSRICLNGSLKGLLRKIDDPHIIQIEKSTAVNIRYIEHVSHQAIYLANHQKLKLGRTFRLPLCQAMINQKKGI